MLPRCYKDKKVVKLDEIAVVIIIYNPDEADINNVKRIAEVYKGAVVDNSTTKTFQSSLIGKMNYIHNGENLGIAESQNKGIRAVMKDMAVNFIVFFDQDSRSDTDYPLLIANKYEEIGSFIHNLAILGPWTLRLSDGASYIEYQKEDIIIEGIFIKQREIISSGSCISIKVLNVVGLNDASLFIDNVDYEWCWRANSKGYVCGITPQIKMWHQIGQREVHVNIGKPYCLIISAPFRYFYQYRNFLWLRRRDYVPSDYKRKTLRTLIRYFFFFPLFVKGGFKIQWQMIRGILAGLRNPNHSLPSN